MTNWNEVIVRKLLKYILGRIKTRTSGHIKDSVIFSYRGFRKYKSKLSKAILKYCLYNYLFGSSMRKRTKNLFHKSIESFKNEKFYDFGIFKMPLLAGISKDLSFFEFGDFSSPLRVFGHFLVTPWHVFEISEVKNGQNRDFSFFNIFFESPSFQWD